MRAVFVCESMLGSTKKVAEAIAEGLADGGEVSVVPVTSAGAHVLDGADLVVVGGPTHAHGMSRPSTRWNESWTGWQEHRVHSVLSERPGRAVAAG